jgi:hypothetical protein
MVQLMNRLGDRLLTRLVPATVAQARPAVVVWRECQCVRCDAQYRYCNDEDGCGAWVNNGECDPAHCNAAAHAC